MREFSESGSKFLYLTTRARLGGGLATLTDIKLGAEIGAAGLMGN